ncbi:MAG TPA: hypothetical protein VK011_05875 [Acidimicrobiia bacterium]|nr:hypothetical protein [Acidimicrobiia bacterium]
MPGAWSHLAARFFDFISAPALRPDEIAQVEKWLAGRPRALRAFFGQPRADQRHGYEAARSVERAAHNRPDLIRAALLHDVGKRHADLGAIGRVLATLAIRLRLPLTPRWRLYRDHGRLAAAELGDEEAVVVEFARHHHIGRPPTISAGDWEILSSADRARVLVGSRDR